MIGTVVRHLLAELCAVEHTFAIQIGGKTPLNGDSSANSAGIAILFDVSECPRRALSNGNYHVTI
jgi:hypothetical protein